MFSDKRYFKYLKKKKKIREQKLRSRFTRSKHTLLQVKAHGFKMSPRHKVITVKYTSNIKSKSTKSDLFWNE